VRRLARVSGVSQAHFARSFRDAFGVPPHRYLLTRRIERAKTLLRDTGLPVTEVAFETGWNSLGTFGRVFRDITGESPGELRSREQPRRTLGTACRPAISAPRTGPTSQSQFRRSDVRRRPL
jgi:transcriptional regulator GlxA family with amidase domain